ncbi:MAG TPA: YciI family protein [Blastocatellia bacterium]|nr:YciI family protein [Blastocatellia bacterium]
MRVMVIIKANKESEAGIMPDEKFLAKMMEYNEELVKAGVMLAGEGLHPSSRAKRVKFSLDAPPVVIDGPFAETKELIAGFWLWKVDSLDEAVEWIKRCPAPEDAQEGVMEIRQVFDIEDFGDTATPEIREQEERLRAQIEKQGA